MNFFHYLRSLFIRFRKAISCDTCCMQQKISSVGDKIVLTDKTWSFSHLSVVKNLFQHMRKSIPFYDLGIQTILDISDLFVHENSVIVDLGCYKGQLLHDLAHKFNKLENIQLVGIEKEESMLNSIPKNRDKRLHFFCNDLENIKTLQSHKLLFERKLSFVIAHYSLQFLSQGRKKLLDLIYTNLEHNGALVVFEKITVNPKHSGLQEERIYSNLFSAYKRRQGYSLEEIHAKKQSLEGVLHSLSKEENVEMLKEAGFKVVIPILQHTYFIAWLAIK